MCRNIFSLYQKLFMHCILPQQVPKGQENKGIISLPLDQKLQNHIYEIWTSNENNV